MKRAALSWNRFCLCSAVLLIATRALSAPAAQPAATESVTPCDGALHSAQPLGQWQLDLGQERMTTISVPLPANSDILLEAQELGIDVELEVTATQTAYARNPILRQGILRVLLRTDHSGRAAIAARATVDRGSGHRVMLRAYNESDRESDSCRWVRQAIVNGDAAYAQARRVSDGLGTPNSQSAADFYASAYAQYQHAFVGLAPHSVALGGELAHALATLSCQYLQRWRDCELWSTQAIRLLGLAGDAHNRADALSLQAVSWMELAQLPDAATAADPVRGDSRVLVSQALDQLRGLVAFYSKRGERLDAAEQLNVVGLTLYNSGDYTASMRAYRRAQSLCEKIGARYRLALVLQNIALVEWDLGRASTALKMFRRALDLIDVVDSPVLYALILNNYGMANRTAGHLDAALAQHSQALELTTRLQVTSEQGPSLLGIAMVYSAAGDRAQATTFLHQALDAFTQGGEGRESVSALRALANIAAQDGHHEEAIRLDREALAHATDPPVRTRLLAQIADSESLVGFNQAAADDIALAARIPRADDPVSHSLVQRERGVLDYRAGRWALARTRLQSALATDRAFGLDAAAFDTEVLLARVNVAAGHLQLASCDLDAALKLSEMLRVQISDPELRATSMQPLRTAFELKVDLLAGEHLKDTRAGDIHGAEGAARAALAVTESARARVMRDISLADYSRADAARVDQLLGQKSQLLGDLAAHEDRLKAGVSSAKDTRLATIRSDVAPLREQLAVVDSQLAILSRAPGGIHSVRAGANAVPPPDVAIISYWLGASDAYAWLQTQSRVRLINLGSADTVRAVAEANHSTYSTLDGSSIKKRLQSGASLSRLVLQPVLAQMPAEVTRLIVIPDGALHYVSFAALPTRPDTQDSFLIEKYEIAYGSSVATVLSTDARQEPTDGMLLVADAVYAADDPRIIGTKPAASLLAAETPRLRSALNTAALERLPATAAEANGIAQLAVPLKLDDLEGFEATRGAVLSRRLENYRYIHFAVHAITDSEIPQLSSLVLSTYDSGGHRLENRIWAGDLMGRRFGARTIVLSACDTALGRDIGGEGLFSLRYVLLARGAHSVVASLWAVPDRSTALLMQIFYRHLLQGKRQPGSALTLAMRQMLRQGPRDPVFWAPFTATVASLE